MARIRSSETSPERALRSALWRLGHRYRLYSKRLAGKPDIVFGRRRVVVFIDGCFWHGCPDHYVPPRSRSDYWSAKLKINTERDARRTVELEQLGWRVVRIWECEVELELDRAVARIVAAIENDGWKPEPRWVVVSVTPLRGERERRTLRTSRAPYAEKVETRFRSFRRQGVSSRQRAC
jgi:DNA mismatch endonuclease (patch repair protein)